jgi:hypothetical protein
MAWDDAYKAAAEVLKGTDSEGGPDAMKKSYQEFERGLPPERRRRNQRREGFLEAIIKGCQEWYGQPPERRRRNQRKPG